VVWFWNIDRIDVPNTSPQAAERAPGILNAERRNRQRVMTHVITQACIDCIHRSCVKECPVDCIYEGARALYIQPDECIDCSACVPACPEDAIYHEQDLPEPLQGHLEDNKNFFAQTLPGKSTPLQSPGGAKRIGRFGVDTPLVASYPCRQAKT
jgi:Fe-S-cluster-containing hydrogenase component 2